MVDDREIYYAKIFYEDEPSKFKIRPVLVLNCRNNGDLLIVEITSKPINNPPKYYDNFKYTISNWRSLGFNRPSYVKCNKVHIIGIAQLRNKIGIMDELNYINIVDKITNVI